MSWIKLTLSLVLSHRFVLMQPVLPVFFFLAALLVPGHAFAVVGAAPNTTIQNLPNNTWYEVPNSQMFDVEAKDADYPGIWGNHPDSIDPKPSNFRSSAGVFLWSGAAFDDKRNRLVLWGGGHNSYYGNELYAFDLTTLSWERVTNPSPPTDWANCVDVLSDGRPNSRHTYYNLAYIPTTDKFFSTPGGTTSCIASGPDYNTWSFDFDDKEWVNLNPATESYGDGKPKQPPVWAPTAAAYNPLDNKVYSTGPDGFFVYDVATNRWDKLNSTALWEDRGAAVDEKRGLLVVVGRGEVVVYDLANQNYTPQFWDTQGDEAYNLNNDFRPGVNYDPVADRIVVWDGGAVRALNMDTRQWDDLAEAPQVRHPKGTYGRFRYSQRENAYVLVNDATENVLIYKLANNDSAALSIVMQPVAVTVDQGQSVTFSVLAVGSGTLSYQWRKDGANIDGATMASYNFTASDMANNGARFDVVVSNASGSVTSSGADLTIVADVIAPVVDAVGALGQNTVQVVFSEPVTLSSAEDTGNYVFSPTVAVSDARLGSNGRVVLLTVTGLDEGSSYSLVLNGIVDRAPVPNTIIADTSVNFVYRASEGFEDGNAAGFEPRTPSRWTVVQDDGDYAYSLNTSNFSSPGNGLLGEYSLLPGVYGDVVFSLNARLGDDVASNDFADMALLFGYQDDSNYYYLMLNNEMTETKLYKVESGNRSVLATATTDWLNDNAYHAIEITRNGDRISVTIDGNPLLDANDATFALGRLGVGSFNDSAYFDDLSVTGALSAGTVPVITLVGGNPQVITVGGVYTESGATAVDDVDGNITANIAIDVSAVNTAAVGSYEVTYNISDAAGNAASEVVRTVNVVAAAASTTVGTTTGSGGGGALGGWMLLVLMLFSLFGKVFINRSAFSYNVICPGWNKKQV